jgi:hypothetical protein
VRSLESKIVPKRSGKAMIKLMSCNSLFLQGIKKTTVDDHFKEHGYPFLGGIIFYAIWLGNTPEVGTLAIQAMNAAKRLF